MTMQPPQPSEVPSTSGRVSEQRALGALAERLTEAGLEAALDTKQPAFPVVFILIPGTRALREMVFVSGGEFVWDGSQCRVDDVASATAMLTRYIQNLAARFTQSPEQHYWNAQP